MKIVDHLKLLLERTTEAPVDVEMESDGHAWLTARQGKRLITIEYRPRRGIFLTDINADSNWSGFGSRPSAKFQTLRDVQSYFSTLNAKSGTRVRSVVPRMQSKVHVGF